MKIRILFIITLSLLLASFPIFAQEPGPKMTDTVTFRVNMQYLADSGKFDPLNDTVGLSGTWDQWTASDFLTREGTSKVYQVKKVLSAGVVYHYLFSIHKADTVLTEEITDATTRMIRVPDTTWTVTGFFSNINPTSVPMTFYCDMYYQIHAGHFTTYSDWLDVAGNFNDQGANTVLFNILHDSLFKVTIFLDTSYIHASPLRFKYRINGSWATAELQGDSSRTYTMTGTDDSFSAWYNNIDPTVPALPIAYNLMIQDTLNAEKTVTGAYQYEDYNLKPEGISLYQWYVADSIGGPVTEIDSAYHINYTIDSVYVGKYLVFEVTPVTIDSIVGLPVRVYSPSVISWVGIPEKIQRPVRIYPNPVVDILSIEPVKPIKNIELTDLRGRILLSLPYIQDKTIRISTTEFSPGIYFLRVTEKNSQVSILKVVIR
jgi:hypothetical protein